MAELTREEVFETRYHLSRVVSPHRQATIRAIFDLALRAIEQSNVRVLYESDAFCPCCGHNRDWSLVSTIDNGDGAKTCQLCSAQWHELRTIEQRGATEVNCGEAVGEHNQNERPVVASGRRISTVGTPSENSRVTEITAPFAPHQNSAAQVSDSASVGATEVGERRNSSQVAADPVDAVSAPASAEPTCLWEIERCPKHNGSILHCPVPMKYTSSNFIFSSEGCPTAADADKGNAEAVRYKNVAQHVPTPAPAEPDSEQHQRVISSLASGDDIAPPGAAPSSLEQQATMRGKPETVSDTAPVPAVSDLVARLRKWGGEEREQAADLIAHLWQLNIDDCETDTNCRKLLAKWDMSDNYSVVPLEDLIATALRDPEYLEWQSHLKLHV